MAAGLVIPQGSLFSGLAEVIKAFDSNVTLAQYDLVNVQNGQLEVTDAGETIAGYVVQKAAVSSSSTGVQVNITPFMQVIMDSDETNDNLAQDLIGEYFNTTGGTGAQIVDIDSTTVGENPATSAQLCLLDQNDTTHWDAGQVRDSLRGDTSVGRYLIVEAQFGPKAGA